MYFLRHRHSFRRGHVSLVSVLSKQKSAAASVNMMIIFFLKLVIVISFREAL